MGWLKKKPDPLTDRARDLNNEIAALEAQIKKLDAKMQRDAAQPRLRSTAMPRGETVSHSESQAAVPQSNPLANKTASHEPIFEDLEQRHLKSTVEPPSTPDHYNELGARKYDVTEMINRVKRLFSGPNTTNPRLVSYLAAGGIQGLQPLRREKRVARNRFLALAAFFLLILLGIIYMFARTR